MIDKALIFIRDVLNQELKLSLELEDEPVVVSSLINPDGSPAASAENKIVISIINLEHETAVKSRQDYYREASDTGFGQVRPPVYLNVYLLISANYDSGNYLEANKRLSKVISTFQGHSYYTKQAYPSMQKPLEKLTFELYNLPINELSHIWSGIGAKYVPSVIYKVRMLNLQEDRIDKEIPGITGLSGLTKTKNE